MFTKFIRKTAALAGLGLLALAGPAAADDVVKVGYMKVPPLVSYLYAERNGLFDKHGVETELTILNNGPAGISAMASGAIDIGMTGTTAIALAAANRQPVNIFGVTDWAIPETGNMWIIANKAAGVESIADLEGKTVAIVGPFTQSDVALKSQLNAAGIDPRKVRTITVPFPQTQAALEQGNADAAVLVAPFNAAILASTKIDPVVIASGPVGNFEGDMKFPLAVWFSRPDWLETNSDKAAAFLAAIFEANQALTEDRSKLEELLVSDFGMPPEAAAHAQIPLNTVSVTARGEEFQIVQDALLDTGMLRGDFDVKDAVVTVE